MGLGLPPAPAWTALRRSFSAVALQDGSEQAQSNLCFLSILKDPFQELSTLRPKDISEKLPHLISLVRIVWVNSPYYNSRERITALFRKVGLPRRLYLLKVHLIFSSYELLELQPLMEWLV